MIEYFLITRAFFYYFQNKYLIGTVYCMKSQTSGQPAMFQRPVTLGLTQGLEIHLPLRWLAGRM